MHHVNVKSMSRCCYSSNAVSIMSAMMRLCFATSLLLNDDSADVTLSIVFIDSVISINFELTNFLPLSANNISGARYICIHDLKIASRMTSGSTDLAKLDADNLVAWWIKS